MKTYIVHNASGRILRTGMCQEEVFDSIPEDGEFIVEGYCSEPNKQIINGVISDLDLDDDEMTDADKRQLFRNELRELRDKYLQESDWTQMPDSPLPVSEKQKWAEYRQDLRDYGNNLANVRVREAKYLREITFPRTPKNKNAEVTTIDEN